MIYSVLSPRFMPTRCITAPVDYFERAIFFYIESYSIDGNVQIIIVGLKRREKPVTEKGWTENETKSRASTGN